MVNQDKTLYREEFIEPDSDGRVWSVNTMFSPQIG